MTDPHSTDPMPPGATWSPRAYRNLKIAVIVMGVLLVVGFTVLFVTIISRLVTMGSAPERMPVASELAPDIARLLGPDSEVVSVNADASRLALVVRGPAGLSVIVVDLRSGAVINVIGAE